MSDDIKPRVDEDGVAWCDGECPQCEYYDEEELTALCGIDGMTRDAHHSEVEPTCEPTWQGNLCYPKARRNAALLRECRDALMRYRSEVPVGHQPAMFAHAVDDLLERMEQ